MTSSDDNYEDVREINEDECEDESKVPRNDKACETTGGGVHIDKEDVEYLLAMGDHLRTDIPDLNDRVRRLESGMALVIALVMVSLCF